MTVKGLLVQRIACINANFAGNEGKAVSLGEGEKEEIADEDPP